MGPIKYLVDSNAAIDYLGGKLPEKGLSLLDRVVDSQCIISIITKIEILGYNAPPDDEALTMDFVNASLVIELDNNIVEKTIEIRKNHKIKTPDAIIAATALSLDLTLITRNTADFIKIPALKIRNPYIE